MPDLSSLISPPVNPLTNKSKGPRAFYTALRNNLHGTFNPTADMESPNIHREAMRSMTNKLSDYMEPEVAASVMDIPGFINEGIAGALTPTLAKPTPFFSKQGFDWADIAQNREGQNLAIQDQENRTPPISRMLSMLSPPMMVANEAAKFGRRR